MILAICLIIFRGYGWIFYATITDRPGLNGSFYVDYQLSKIQFSIYNFIVALIPVYISIQILYNIIKSDFVKLKRIFIHFLILLVFIILCEMYLNTRFIGKG